MSSWLALLMALKGLHPLRTICLNPIFSRKTRINSHAVILVGKIIAVVFLHCPPAAEHARCFCGITPNTWYVVLLLGLSCDDVVFSGRRACPPPEIGRDKRFFLCPPSVANVFPTISYSETEGEPFQARHYFNEQLPELRDALSTRCTSDCSDQSTSVEATSEARASGTAQQEPQVDGDPFDLYLSVGTRDFIVAFAVLCALNASHPTLAPFVYNAPRAGSASCSRDSVNSL